MNAFAFNKQPRVQRGAKYFACRFTAGSPLSFTREAWHEFVEVRLIFMD